MPGNIITAPHLRIAYSIVVAAVILVIGIGIGIRGSIPEAFVGVLGYSTYAPKRALPLSHETIIQLINSSIQSGTPLWLRGANLSAANLVKADLHGAYLGHANLYGADLRLSDLRNANLWKANLTEVNFLGADLRNSDLSGADLYQADLRGANLTGAHLVNTNLEKAKYNRFTTWPDGFDPILAGAEFLEA